MLNHKPPIAEVIRFCQTRSKKLLLLLLVAAALPAGAQDFYVITNGNNILAHTDATTIGNVTGNSFNINTCLWAIVGNKIATVTPEGTTGYQIYWTGNNQALTLRETGDDYNNVSDGQNPYNIYRSSNYYIVYNNGWKISSTNSNNGTMHRVTVTTNTTTGSTPTSESYTATIGGNTAIYTTGAHNFSRTITHSATYTTTTTKTFSVSINGTNRSGNTTENGTTTTTETYTGALTNVAWSVSPTTYGDINATTGVLTITSLPASTDNLTVTYTAQAGGQPVSGTMTVMLAKDAATYDELINGSAPGISGGIVTLNDYEPHEWSYYSDASLPEQLRRLNPVNVKITYYGYGTKTMTGSNTDQLPANSDFDQGVVSTAVQVNKGEAGNTFVYYKTLENANADGTGNYPYTMIPNPFQVRPTYGDDDSRWRGFYAWRVKSLSSGLSIKVGSTTYTSSNVSAGIIIYTEQEVEFITANEYGNTVEFEALWAKA